MAMCYRVGMQKLPNIKSLQISLYKMKLWRFYLCICVTLVVLFVAVDQANAKARVCTGKPMPKNVCALVYKIAPHVRGADRSWANSHALAAILKAESGFDFYAVKGYGHKPGYQGINSCGLFQRTPCDPWVFASKKRQIRWGLKYLVHRYGSPSEALRHKRLHGWY